MVLRLGHNSTLTLLREEFPNLGAGASGAVTQLFLEMSLYILGSDANVNDMVSTFFSRLFPFTYQRLLEAFDMVLRLGRNSTLTLLREEFPNLGAGASGAVTQLFLEMSLYILGSDANVNDMVSTFFSRLFPFTYQRLLGNGAVTSISEECLRGAWSGTSAFGSFPKMMMTRLSRSLLATRVFLQALNLGIEVVNTTQHLRAGRDCGRSLLKLWYCPHCQGLLEARPCRSLCVSTMGACLGGAMEVQPHWRSYVEELGSLAAAMKGEQDIEEVLQGQFVSLIAFSAGRLPRGITFSLPIFSCSQVSGICAHAPSRVSRAAPMSAEHAAASLVAHSRPTVNFDPGETLFGRRREFISGLRGFSQFYSGLGEALCSKEPTALNRSLCWNGQEMTDKFLPSTLENQFNILNIESRQKPPEPVISQIIDKLKHINQVSYFCLSSHTQMYMSALCFIAVQSCRLSGCVIGAAAI
uniref:Glypican-3 n=1 Tax=Sinocyclocheilus rhinocerous TaxID=307959 RepID=A0A673K2N1_9TELE